MCQTLVGYGNTPQATLPIPRQVAQDGLSAALGSPTFPTPPHISHFLVPVPKHFEQYVSCGNPASCSLRSLCTFTWNLSTVSSCV